MSGWIKRGLAPIGVDISPHGVKLLQLRKGRDGLTVVASSSAPLDEASMSGAFAFASPSHSDAGAHKSQAEHETPTNSIDAWSAPEADPGALIDQEEREPAPPWKANLTQALTTALAAGAFQGRRCTIALSDEFLRVRSVRQPRMPKEEATCAIRLEAADRLGFRSGIKVEIDWIEAGEVRQGEDVREELILVGAESTRLAHIVDAVGEVGLAPIAVEPAFLAQARALGRTLRRADDTSLVRLIIDIGRRQTGVIVTRGSDVVFYKALEIGGERFDAAAAQRLGARPESVADLRRQRMRTPATERDPRVDRAMFESIRPVMSQLTQEAALCLRYYSVTFFGERPTLALLVGDEAREPGLVKTVGESLSVPAAVATPLDGVALDGVGAESDRRSELAEWSTSVGACLLGFPIKRIESDKTQHSEAGSSTSPVKEAAA